jgi:uncharacterized protein DUF6745
MSTAISEQESQRTDARLARELILAGRAPAEMRVAGVLDLADIHEPFTLPDGLVARRLVLRGSTGLARLPRGLRCYELDARQTRLRRLPNDIAVENRLDLEGCTALEQLPEGLKVGSLVLRDCAALTALPEGLDVYFLDITGCSQLVRWPRSGALRIGRLLARGCTRLATLPSWLTDLAQLDVGGCESLTDLPPTLRVTSWIDLAHTGISWLPVAARGAQIRWRGVPIDERIAFRPETITGAEVLGEQNAERRRVLLERMGYEAFLQHVQAQELHRDQDAGGERRLLQVPLDGDEPLVCLAVFCPSTGRQYLLRVPPNMRTCHQAAAWIAGFDNPKLYRPIAES